MSRHPNTRSFSPIARVLLLGLLLAVFLQGCLLVSIRPVGKGIGVKSKDLPQVSSHQGHKVYSLIGPDRIPAIDEPQMLPASQADFMADEELILGVTAEGEARAYSLWHLDRHEIVNDWLGGDPIAATW